ncbi:hypothetical protein [Acidithiobacillus concretivorus]|uniref:Uncharacterized protein n=1 Tax=Acidithiobacillus concretivorus TaxID=3063952 RepID=A0ABS5ZPJ2_9PROT|nr:hypothetical protein [Acidithiobacillus concretivorus]MBU2738553.1 hypothetical protein [Acidithiobacillus concretivorus]
MNGITVFALTAIGIALFIGAFYLFLDYAHAKSEQASKAQKSSSAHSPVSHTTGEIS